MNCARKLLAALFAVLLPALTSAADFDNPLAAIASRPDLSEMHGLLKKTGYAEPLAGGGDITFLAMTNDLLKQPAPGTGGRFTMLELMRDKIPPEAQLLMLQAMTLDGQYTQAQLGELIDSQGEGKAEVLSVLGPDAKYRLRRGKQPGTIILEDIRRNGMVIGPASEIDTPNGTVMVVGAGVGPGG